MTYTQYVPALQLAALRGRRRISANETEGGALSLH